MKRFISASILAATLASGAAVAQVGPYVGASVGQSNYGSTNCVGTCDKTDIGMKLFGGYMFTPYIGVEGHYGAYGNTKVNTTGLAGTTPVSVNGEVKASSLNGYVVGQFPIDNFRLFGKAGFAYTNSKTTFNVPPQTVLPVGFSGSDTTSSTQFAFGLGATYMFNKNLGVRAEWENMKYEFGNSGAQTLTFLSIGVQYHF